MIVAVNPPGVWSPFGAFSMAVVQGEGQIVHLKGQVSLDRDGQIVGKSDMRAQVRKALENVRDMLASMGGQMTDVISLVHYATDICASRSPVCTCCPSVKLMLMICPWI
jgi:2-iminobutanoate/2-iminopropanoate deaminase